MKKRFILFPFIFFIIGGLFFGGLIFAQGQPNSSESKIYGDFITKVSTILGLEEKIVINAFNDALIQIHDEKNIQIELELQNKIDSGFITKEEANQWRTKFLKKKTPTFDEFFRMKKDKSKIDKPYMNGFIHHDKGKYPIRKMDIEKVKEKINKAVESGEITQEEADIKINSLKVGKQYMNAPRSYKEKDLKKEFDISVITKRMDQAIKAGILSQEDANTRLEAFKKYKKKSR